MHAAISFGVTIVIQLLFWIEHATGSIGLHSSSTTVRGQREQCTDSRAWTAGVFHQQHCIMAIDDMYRDDVQARQSQTYEFISPGIKPITKLPKILLPKKYTVGTCVIAIAMLDTFRPGSLPGSTARIYTSSDTAMFDNAWDAALNVEFACLQSRPQTMGWSYMGKSGSIGVFLFGQGSLQDRLITNMVPLPTSPFLESPPTGLASIDA